MDVDPTNLIVKAIRESKFEWRTPNGIARELKMSPAAVANILEADQRFIRSSVPNKKGEPLYSTREHRSWFSRFWAAAANTTSS